MRHLSVPSQETQRILHLLKTESALPEGARVRSDPSDSDRRIIPFTENVSQSILDQFPIIDIEVEEPPPRTYREHLADLLPVDVFESTDWPTRHEFVGDLILIKLDEIQRQYGDAIGEALLRQHSRIRAVFEDLGVIDTFRVRDLRLLAVRDGHEPTTRTQTSVNGHNLWTDPATVYYSSKLHHERDRTLDCAKRLRDELGRPLTVCDPYAGVGPALVSLLAEEDLIERAWGSDLNPDAVDLMKENLSEYNNIDIHCMDALSLSNIPELRGNFDVLLINIPHSTLSHLPSAIPLLRESTPTLLRGWIVVEESKISATKEEIRNIFPMDSELEFSIRRSYSSTQLLCRFEIRMNH